MASAPAFAVHRAAGSAADLHARAFEPPVERAVFALDVERPALVLGSAQPDAVVEHAVAARFGVEVARRRSGGGAVLLQPGAQVWVDVEVPRDDPLWDDDVGRACWWVGDVWARALGGLGVPEPLVHRRGLERRAGSDLVCFAGLGPGEVTTGGAKVVGISQRRTRAGARFQCAVPLAWDADLLAAVLPEAAAVAVTVHVVPATSDAVVAAFLAELAAAAGA
jgi:lipoate-protein ligase A